MSYFTSLRLYILSHDLLDGMFAILVPAALAPLIFTLLWAEGKAKRLGMVADTLRRHEIDSSPLERMPSPVARQREQKPPRVTLFGKLGKVAGQLDLVGLLLLGAAVALILLPLTLTQTANRHWKNRMCAVRFPGLASDFISVQPL